MTLDFIIEVKLIVKENIYLNPIIYIIQTNLKEVKKTTTRCKNITASFFDNFNHNFIYQLPITI